jgi:hypothetical protein
MIPTALTSEDVEVVNILQRKLYAMLEYDCK